jgi:hypothetical protein
VYPILVPSQSGGFEAHTCSRLPVTGRNLTPGWLCWAGCFAAKRFDWFETQGQSGVDGYGINRSPSHQRTTRRHGIAFIQIPITAEIQSVQIVP